MVADMRAGDHGGVVHLGERAPRGLEVEGLKHDLAALWKEEGAARAGEGAVTRVCHSTLVVPLGNGDEEHDLIDDIIRLFPSRIIAVHADAGRPRGDAEAWVSASCSRGSDGGSLVCCETIHVAAGPGTGRLVVSAIRSLSVGGVPVVVLSEPVSPLEVDWIEALDGHLDLVLGDGVYLEPDAGVGLWRRCLEDGGAPPDYRDLLWTRLADWRRALALPFDPPGEAAALASVTAVEMEVARGPGWLLKGWLLAGWLASRLDWKWFGGEDAPDRLRFRGPAGPVEFRTVARNAGDDPAAALSVTMEFAGRPAIRWRRLAEERAIVVESGGERLSRLNQSKMSRASAVVREIHRHAPDPVAAEAMASAVRFRDTLGN